MSPAPFGDGAARLAGVVSLAFGWGPDAFWNATPAEVAALIAALNGGAPAPLDSTTIDRLKEQYPDG